MHVPVSRGLRTVWSQIVCVCPLPYPLVPPSQIRSTNAQLRGAETGSARIQVDATGDMSWSEETATSYLTENSDKFLGQTSPSSVASTWTQVRKCGRVFLPLHLSSFAAESLHES